MFGSLKNYYLIFVVILAGISIDLYPIAFAINSPFGQDPFPVYSTQDPHEFLYRRHRQRLKGLWEEDDEKEYKDERFGFSISPYAQYADRGRSKRNYKVYLGDIPGRWNMLALLFGELPDGKTLPPLLTTAQNEIFGGKLPASKEENLVDPNQQYGFFTTPLKYRRFGLRFELDFQMIKDFGLTVQFGFSNICQTLEDICDWPEICHGCETPCTIPDETTLSRAAARSKEGCPRPLPGAPIDLTDKAEDFETRLVNYNLITTATTAAMEEYLMDRLCSIGKEINLCLSEFSKTAPEDLHFNFYWRHAFEINPNPTEEWANFLLIPYFVARITIPTGEKKDPNFAYALPFGNNGHYAFGFLGGINIDFTETVEFGLEAGATHFFRREFCNYRVPNSCFQQGIYPFTTGVLIEPGLDFFGGFKLSAYHFISMLSGYFQFVAITHRGDKIRVCNCDPAFKPQVLEKLSCWSSMVANIGFNYDISPNISLGFLWQAPLAQKNAYRSSTAMFSFNFDY